MIKLIVKFQDSRSRVISTVILKLVKMFYDPLLRPIISQIGTVTYLTAKWLNSMITKYMNKRYMIESTYEFITISKFIENPETVASLDVESLFTNIPVNKTTEIIVHEVYDHRICQGNHLKTSVQ